MKLTTMALIFAGIFLALVLILAVIKKKSTSYKIKSSKEKKQGIARITGLFIIGGTGVADFFLYDTLGKWVLVGVTLLLTIIAITLIQTAGGGFMSFINANRKRTPKGPYIDDDENFHPDPDYDFYEEVADDPVYNEKTRDTYFDADGNERDSKTGIIISPAMNTDTSYQEDPRRAI